MRTLLHFIAILLALPGIVLAAAFLALGHAIGTHSLPGFFIALLELIVWLVPWGLLASVIALFAIALAGFSRALRPFAAAFVALLAVSSSIVLLVLTTSHGNFEPAQLGFFVPALVAAMIGAWLAASEWRVALTRSVPQAPAEVH